MRERREIDSFAGFICRSTDRIVACLEGFDAQELNWRPPAAGANSLYALAVHTVANAEENILSVLCGEPVQRSHAEEWVAEGISAEPLRERWRLLRERIATALANLPPSELEHERVHPRRGALTGREVLLVVARHAAEHMGQAELTRDLLNAAQHTVTPRPSLQ